MRRGYSQREVVSRKLAERELPLPVHLEESGHNKRERESVEILNLRTEGLGQTVWHCQSGSQTLATTRERERERERKREKERKKKDEVEDGPQRSKL